MCYACEGHVVMCYACEGHVVMCFAWEGHVFCMGGSCVLHGRIMCFACALNMMLSLHITGFRNAETHTAN